jgi:hypothetical protein
MAFMVHVSSARDETASRDYVRLRSFACFMGSRASTPDGPVVGCSPIAIPPGTGPEYLFN